MQTQIIYEDYLTSDNKQILSEIISDLSQSIRLRLLLLNDNDTKMCKFSLEDKIGVGVLSETLDKQNLRELIELIKKVYEQL